MLLNETLTMKKLILFSILSISFLGYSQNEFSDGYKAGYKEGNCFDKTVGCISRIPPIAPIPPVGKNTYKDGYNIGFTKGKSDAPSKNTANSTLVNNNSSNNTYEKYKDANKYQSGGKAESDMIDKAIEQGQADGQALGNAIAIAVRAANQEKHAKYSFLYKKDPTLENAFGLSKAHFFLYADYGDISDEHKLLVIKYKRNYKKYLRAVKKGKEKPE